MDTRGDLLKVRDLSESTELDQEASFFLQDFQPYHTEFQIEAFIIKNAGDCHPWGMYQQCLREIDTRQVSLRGLRYRLAELEISIEENAVACARWAIFRKARWKKRRALLERDRLLQEREGLRRQYKDCEREMALFVKHAKELRPKVTPLTVEHRHTMDIDYWAQKLVRRIAIISAQQGVPSADVYGMLGCLPEDVEIPVRAALENHRQLAMQLMHGESVDLKMLE